MEQAYSSAVFKSLSGQFSGNLFIHIHIFYCNCVSLFIIVPFIVLAKELVISTLSSLRELISSIAEEPTKTKDIMYNSTKNYIELSRRLFTVYISQSGK